MKIPIALLLLGCLTPNLLIADEIDFVRDVQPIFEAYCYDCHGEAEQESGLRLDVKQAALKGGFKHGPDIVPGKVDDSPLATFITTDDEDQLMPPGGGLTDEEINILLQWIDQGAVWPDGVDKAQLEDRLDHWSFKPVRSEFHSASIDEYIEAELSKHQLSFSESASRQVWLRRVTFDLIGLPPTPEEIEDFLNDHSDRAFEKVVDRLLDSPRYGERWAQHWLDVVRFADTHGFEVNTERPNAWPYRDYVIRSFNDDTPYDQFVKEQIVGDMLGADAATGFLVTASVLLPGQIGKDEPSMRLARQDALDEIVNNISQTFLGLSVGCARCHDHKFDPITAKDYYAMQAFVAGVEYEDREIEKERDYKTEQQIKRLSQQIQEIDEQLLELTPLARPESQQEWTNATENIESFEPTHAKFIRFTIHNSNLHPTLGLIEPCIDEFEIYADSDRKTNLALASAGTKVTASGSRTSAAHRLEHVNDGKLGNPHSWMSDSPGTGWLLFELPEKMTISQVFWSRDRLGEFTDRLPTGFTLEVGLRKDDLKPVRYVLPPRGIVQAAGPNVDRFSPIRTSQIRFEITTTNSLEPCIDEIEVFNSAGQNVALSESGTTARTSGDIIVADRHDPSFLNDGRYGNSRSWLGNQPGVGWIELTFESEQEIEQVRWSRDRLAEYDDRLATAYRIQVKQGGKWITVADSTDRLSYVEGLTQVPISTRIGLSDEEKESIDDLHSQRDALLKQKETLTTPPLMFAGRFRQPDQIYLLNRGDPEQPGKEVSPAVIEALGDLSLVANSPEQDRRQTLAEWIASSDNPLTARVIVNRVWQGHFGSGLVNTPSDFGRNGAKPSHPELLDFLAKQFAEQGWSIKSLHRMVVLSKTYRQSSQSNLDGSQVDADVRYLWRFPSRRLDAETIRDSMLSVSGLLNERMYGRGFNLFDKRGGLTGFEPVQKLSSENQRRMIYAHKVRRETDSVFGAFDCPDAGQSTALRRTSTTPIQALNLFNSWFTISVSEAFAQRVEKEAGTQVDAQINRAFQLSLGRAPDDDELNEIRPVVAKHGLPVLCRVLFNCNEFVMQP